MRLMTLALLLLPLAAHADAWDDALAGAGLTRETARFNPLDLAMAGEGAFRLPTYEAIEGSPLSAPFHARLLRSGILGSAGNAGDLVAFGAGRIGAGTRRTLLGDPLAATAALAGKPGALESAILHAWRAGFRAPSPGERARLKSAIAGLPADVCEQAAFVLEAEISALRWRNRALAPVWSRMDAAAAWRLASGETPLDDDAMPSYEAMMSAADLKRLMVGGEELAMACDRAAAALGKRTVTGRFGFRAWTPLGWIVLNGDGRDIVDRQAPYLLILDTGGDDLYRAGGGTTGTRYPVSVLIDVNGNDRYVRDAALDATPVMQWTGRKEPRREPCFGAGVLGYGILVDGAGNDVYRATGPAMGRGVFGMGLLLDRAGNDMYDAYSGAQGAGDFGVGILADLAGSDRYLCLQTAQGYGGTMGFGLLLDRGDGADSYVAEDKVIDDPSGQSPLHNTSMAQGAGNGRRADFSDGHSLAGGLGVLLDEGGDNHLSAGVFAQGVGYWMGVGACLLGPGSDTLDGAWYVQGAAAHFAVGLCDDLGGNDTYRATINMAQGAGHDWSVGWLIDHAGNDVHEAPNLSLGGGNATGFGFFWDLAGEDTYRVKPSVTLGGAGGGIAPSSLRERNPTLGVFLDSGGRDTYPTDIPGAKDNGAWHVLRGVTKEPGGERSSALDTEAPNLAEPM